MLGRYGACLVRMDFQWFELPFYSVSTKHVYPEVFQGWWLLAWPNLGRFSQGQQEVHPWPHGGFSPPRNLQQSSCKNVETYISPNLILFWNSENFLKKSAHALYEVEVGNDGGNLWPCKLHCMALQCACLGYPSRFGISLLLSSPLCTLPVLLTQVCAQI